MTGQPSALLRTAYDAREKQQLKAEREACEASLATFIRHAWPALKPMEPYVHNWHIEAICDRLEAVSRGEIRRLQVWVPPGTSKTLLVSVFWPAWEWTQNPWLRYWSASYEVRFAGRIAALSRDLMLSDWYQQRWGAKVKFTRDAENYFANDQGGTRLATAPNSTGSGEHGHRILIDDPINAKEADATSLVTLTETNNWYDGTVVTRGIGNAHARVIIAQRLHESDLCAHVLKLEDWEVLCLPERYEPTHPFVSPLDRRHREGELLWPAYRDEAQSNALAASLTAHRAAGQLQQRPAAKEGDLLKSHWWRFYDPRIRAAEHWDELPRFSMVLLSVDCPQKDKETNDNVAIQAWGIHGVQRYLVDLRVGKMNYSAAKRAVREMSQWARKTWPRARHRILIENTGYGTDLILDLKDEFTGVTKINPQQDGDKVVRADAASDALESGHCFLPGYGPPWKPPVWDPGETPADVNDFIDEAARFPNAAHDDQCFPAGTLVMRPDGPTPIEDVREGDAVLSQTGWTVVERSGMTGRAVVLARFGLQATAHHPIFTQRGWVSFADLAHDDTLLVCDALRTVALARERSESAASGVTRTIGTGGTEPRDVRLSRLHAALLDASEVARSYVACASSITLASGDTEIRNGCRQPSGAAFEWTRSSSEESSFAATRTLSRVPIGTTTSLVANGSSKGSRHFTKKCGKPRTARFRMDGMSTIEMATTPTTRSRIWSAFPQSPMPENTQKPDQSVGVLPNNLRISTRFASLLQSGTGVPLGVSGTGSMPSPSVLDSMAGGVAVPVYNLKTSDGTYFADGVLVHNCDAWSQMINWLRGRQVRPLRLGSTARPRQGQGRTVPSLRRR